MNGRFLSTLIEASDGFSVILAALVGHAVENSRSLLNMRGARDPENAAVFQALRRRFQLKDLPSDSCDPLTTGFAEYLKSISVSVPSCYIEVASGLGPGDGSVTDEVSANDYIARLLNYNQGGANIQRDVASAVGDFNTIADFLQTEGALLQGLPTKSLGMDIALTGVVEVGCYWNLYTSIPFVIDSPEHRLKRCVFADWIRRVDANDCTLESMSELVMTHLMRPESWQFLVEPYIMPAELRRFCWSIHSLGFMKLKSYEAAPLLLPNNIQIAKETTNLGAKASITEAEGTKKPVVNETGESAIANATATSKGRDNIGEADVDQTRAQKNPPNDKEPDQNAKELGKWALVSLRNRRVFEEPWVHLLQSRYV